MKLATIFLIAISITGCQKKVRVPSSDASLIEYAKVIVNEAPVQMRLDYAVYFVDDLEENVIGTCRIIDGIPLEVIIKRSWWASASELERYALMAHEMTHCSLGLAHVIDSVDSSDKLMSKNISGSIKCLSKYDIGPCIRQSIDLYYTGKITAIGADQSKHSKGCNRGN